MGMWPSPELEGSRGKGKVTGRERVSDPIASAGLKISPGATVNISPFSTLQGVNRQGRAIKAMLHGPGGWMDGGRDGEMDRELLGSGRQQRLEEGEGDEDGWRWTRGPERPGRRARAPVGGRDV